MHILMTFWLISDEQLCDIDYIQLLLYKVTHFMLLLFIMTYRYYV